MNKHVKFLEGDCACALRPGLDRPGLALTALNPTSAPPSPEKGSCARAGGAGQGRTGMTGCAKTGRARGVNVSARRSAATTILAATAAPRACSSANSWSRSASIGSRLTGCPWISPTSNFPGARHYNYNFGKPQSQRAVGRYTQRACSHTVGI